MRIIAGLAKGRRLATPGARGGEIIRPTADRAREALFSILGWEFIREAVVLDLFAGTGAMGLEALSRGARQAVFVDNSPVALNLIRHNIEACGFGDRAQVIRHDLRKNLSFAAGQGLGAFDIVFLDPPYRQSLGQSILAALLFQRLVKEQGVVIAEDDSRETLPDSVGRLVLYDRRAYGDTGFWLYENHRVALEPATTIEAQTSRERDD